MSDAPLRSSQVKKEILAALENGQIRYTEHALEEMDNDGITTADVQSVLRGGIIEPAELEGGAWRYRVHTSSIWVVIEIEDGIIVITAWRKK